MPTSTNNLVRSAGSPLWTLLVVLLLVFGFELGIMLLLAKLEPFPGGDFARAVIDAVGLTVVLSPALWLLIVRPLRSLSEQRGRLLSRVYEVQEDERVRLSRDLHDELGQHLTAVLLGLRAVAQAEDVQEARERAARVTRIAGDAMDSVRRLARGLRPAVLADLGLRPSVERLCEDVSTSSGIPVNLVIDLGAVRPAPQVEIGAFRVIQEALTNVVRHSQATQAKVEVLLQGQDLVMRISDNGVGRVQREGSGGGLGIQGMRERVTMLRGDFRVDWATPGRPGTTVSVRIPKVLHEQPTHKSSDR